MVFLCFGSLTEILFEKRATRFVGTTVQPHLHFLWGWWVWPEAHGFCMTPPGLFLWVTAVVCDVVYPFVFWRVRKSERVLADGRKVPGYYHEKKDV